MHHARGYERHCPRQLIVTKIRKQDLTIPESEQARIIYVHVSRARFDHDPVVVPGFTAVMGQLAGYPILTFIMSRLLALCELHPDYEEASVPKRALRWRSRYADVPAMPRRS